GGGPGGPGGVDREAAGAGGGRRERPGAPLRGPAGGGGRLAARRHRALEASGRGEERQRRVEIVEGRRADAGRPIVAGAGGERAVVPRRDIVEAGRVARPRLAPEHAEQERSCLTEVRTDHLVRDGPVARPLRRRGGRARDGPEERPRDGEIRPAGARRRAGAVVQAHVGDELAGAGGNAGTGLVGRPRLADARGRLAAAAV